MNSNDWKDRLKEPSTWRGLAMLAGAVGITIAPGAVEAVIAVVGAIVGLIETVRKEK